MLGHVPNRGNSALVGVVTRKAVVAVLQGHQDDLLDRIEPMCVDGNRMPEVQRVSTVSRLSQLLCLEGELHLIERKRQLYASS